MTEGRHSIGTSSTRWDRGIFFRNNQIARRRKSSSGRNAQDFEVPRAAVEGNGAGQRYGRENIRGRCRSKQDSSGDLINPSATVESAHHALQALRG